MKKAEAIAMLKRIQEPEAWEPQINQAAYEALDMAIKSLEQQPCEDTISRQAAIDAIMGQPPEPHYPSWYAAQIEKLPAAQPQTSMLTVECKLDDEELAKAIEEVKKANLELIAAEPHSQSHTGERAQNNVL